MDSNQKNDEHLELQVENLKSATVYTALFLRLILFLILQAVIALVFLLIGSNQAWQQSTRWWIVIATITNLLTILLLKRWYKNEKQKFEDSIRFHRQTIGRDLLALVATLVVLGPVGFLPINITAKWLFGNVELANQMLIQPIPVWAAAIFGIFFPLSIAFAELPLYFGYIMPRLKIMTGKTWLSILLPALFLAAQHCTLPLIFDTRFILWRFLMFLPFSLFLGIVLNWRRRLLPYLMIVHALMDFATSLFIFMQSLNG